MEFKVRQHQESNNIGNKMVLIKSEKLCLSEYFEALNETLDKILSKFIVQEKCISKTLASFEERFDQISMNIIIKAEKYEPKTTFENNIDEIKYYHMKIITSVYIHISAITSNKPFLSSEHINAYSMTWIT